VQVLSFCDSTITHNTIIQSIRLQVVAYSKPSSDLISSRTINKDFDCNKGPNALLQSKSLLIVLEEVRPDDGLE
jgi:hypothetical protein